MRALKKMGGWKPLSSYQLILEFVKAPFLVLHFCMATVDCCRKRLVVLIALVRLMWKWMGLSLRKTCSRCSGWLCLLNWIGPLYIISFAKTVSEKIGALICFMKFLSPEAVLYINKSTLRPRMESCCHFWAVVPSCYLVMLNKLQNCLSRTEGPLLAGSLQPLVHRRSLASFS